MVARARLLLLLSERLQVADNLRRLPFIAAVQFEKLSVRADHHRAQRMDYLILSGFRVVKIAQAKELRERRWKAVTAWGYAVILISLLVAAFSIAKSSGLSRSAKTRRRSRNSSAATSTSGRSSPKNAA